MAKERRGKAAVWKKRNKGKGASRQNGRRCGDTRCLEEFLAAVEGRAR
jgi:hypothetical protein